MSGYTDYDPMLPGLYGPFFGIPADTIWHGQLTVIPADRPASDGRKRRKQSSAAVARPELLDLMSVRYYVDGRRRQAQQAQPLAPLIDGTPVAAGPFTVYERATALPRTYLVHSVVQAASDAEALERIQTGTFDRRSAVVVQEAVPPLEPARPGSIEHAEIVEYEAHRVRIDADCDTSCLLVLTDLFDPGWRVSVDGSKAKLLRLNFLFRGVHLPPGRHDVTFEYAPISLTAGVVLSLTCALLGIGIVATARWRRG